jgi:FkbM family methyltransferase
MSWTVQFFRKWSPRLRVGSLLRYWWYVRCRARDVAATPKDSYEIIRLDVKSPFAAEVWLRRFTSDDDTLDEVIRRGVYNVVIRRLPDRRYVIDVGANIGLATLFFASAYPQCQILAVEPDERNFALLKRNVGELVTAGRCKVLKSAVWKCDSELWINANAKLPSRSFNGIQVTDRPSEGQSVSGRTLAQFIEQSGFPHIDLLKIDVEGAEAELFNGDVNWLDRVNAIAIEFHEDSRVRSRFDKVVQQRGFTVDDAGQHTVVAIKVAPQFRGDFNARG